jgi:hypothetical protein
MKIIYLLLVAVLLNFPVSNVWAQDCQVLSASIAGTYKGGCRQGKAEGNGKSVGTDTYVGQFKAGLPDGKGTYYWKNGDVFKGTWIKGMREGQGSLAIKREGKSDSLVNGVWKNDVYAGVYVKPEKPYTIYQKSNYYSRADFRKNTNSKENSIEITVTNGSGGVARISSAVVIPPAVISDINIHKGSYSMVMDGSATSRGTTKKLMDVSFPFRAVLTVGGQEIDFEITEPGAWTFILAINQ